MYGSSGGTGQIEKRVQKPIPKTEAMDAVK